MSNLTPELNLVQGEDEDDTADYLTIGLSDSLAILDGMFNASTGHAHNGAHQGSVLGPNAFADNSIPGAKLVDGSVTAIKLAPGIVGPEASYAGSRVTTATNYVVVEPVMFVFCTAGVTVTLPGAAATNRPITVAAVTGQSSINATGGSVVGGSAHPVSGAIQNGVVAAGEAFTYKSDGTNWEGCVTYQNLGYWIAQANDLSTGTHPSGWSNGQRWSETSGEWQAMYNAMVAERDAWITNYNNAIASRDYWQHTVAHNDPNVWDNRYNAGRQSVYNVLNNPDAWQEAHTGWNTGNQGDNYVMTLSRSGHYYVHVVVGFNGNFDHGAGNQTVRVGGSAGVSGQRDFSMNTGGNGCHMQWTIPFHGVYNGGGTITVATPQWAAHGDYYIDVYAHFVSDVTYHN